MNITWLFRKKRDLGNFSIEQSFAEVRAAWPAHLQLPDHQEVSSFSQGLINRLRIIREAKSIKTDILHITGDINFAAIAWPKFVSGRPILVLTIHDLAILCQGFYLQKIFAKWFFFNIPLRFCVNQICVVSPATRRAFVNEFPWFPADKITVIPTVVPQHFQSRKERPNNPKPVALHIGLAENKNLKRHAEALEGIDVHLKIIGEPAKSDFALLENHNIDFSWQSRLSDEEMQEAYASSDFLLFASTLEGFGMPIIEAQMVGLPVITSDVDPMREVAGDGALLCDPLNSISIRASIEEVIGNSEKREDLIQKGFVNCYKYAPATSAALLNDLYERLLNP